MTPAKKTTGRVLKRAKPEPTPPEVEEQVTLDPQVIKRVRLGDNREVRVLKIPTGTGENLIRIGINLLPTGENMSGAVFPESYLPEVTSALLEAARHA